MEFPSHEMMPANLGVALGVADKELMTPVLGAMDRVFTLPSTFSLGEASDETLLTFFGKLGLNQVEDGSLQHLAVEWKDSVLNVFLQYAHVSPPLAPDEAALGFFPPSLAALFLSPCPPWSGMGEVFSPKLSPSSEISN